MVRVWVLICSVASGFIAIQDVHIVFSLTIPGIECILFKSGVNVMKETTRTATAYC